MKLPRLSHMAMASLLLATPFAHAAQAASPESLPTSRNLRAVRNMDIVRTLDRKSLFISADPVDTAVKYQLNYNGKKIYEGRKPQYTDTNRALGVGTHVYSMVAINASGERTTPNVAAYTVDPFPTILPPITDSVVGAVRVDLSEQLVYVFDDRAIFPRLLATIQMSSGTGAKGRPGSTPTGTFNVWSGDRGRSERARFSSTECMDHMVRFTIGFGGGNIGFHSIPYRCGSSPKQYLSNASEYLGIAPSSHGCIRLNDYAAAWLFRNIAEGARVSVID